MNNLRKHIPIWIILTTLLSCNIPNPVNNSDINIVTANLLYSNQTTAKVITEELLGLDADVYILHEAALSNNVDEAFFKASGYSIHDFNDSSHSAFNAVIASRLPADYEYINLEYTYGFDPVFLKPFYSARVIVNSIPILIIGAHIPPAIMMPNELKELRLKAFTEIAEMIADGKLSKSSGGSASQIDDLIILAGDLNTFPSDDILSRLLSSGLDDSIIASQNLYDFTWKPGKALPYIARIDYIFHSKYITGVNHSTHIIVGSDHKAVLSGMSINE